MELVKKALLTLSIALSVAAPLSAYTCKIETWVHEETGKTVELFFDIHPKNYETMVKTCLPQHSLNPTVQNITAKADSDIHNQLNDIINEAKPRSATIIYEGPFIDEPKKRTAAAQQILDVMFLRKLHKQVIADGICMVNAEVRTCFEAPLQAVVEKYLGNSTKQQEYWKGNLSVNHFLSEALKLAFKEAIENYAIAHENHRKKLVDSVNDGPTQQYYNEIMEKIENNIFHQLVMNYSPQEKQTLNNENSAYKNEMNPLQKKAIILMQALNYDMHNRFANEFILLLTGSLLLLDTNIIYNIINSESDVMFVVAGALHCQNLADPLTRLGYKKVKTTERTFANNPLHRPLPGIDSQCIPVHISEHFGGVKKPLEKIDFFAYVIELLRTWMGLK